MTISQEHAILITNLYLSKQYGARRLLSELADRSWKLGSIDSLLRRICKTGTIVRQPGSGRPRSSRSSGGPCAQSTQLNSQFNEKRPHRTHRAKWPLTYAHNKTKK